jgi:hypothetical protein
MGQVFYGVCGYGVTDADFLFAILHDLDDLVLSWTQVLYPALSIIPLLRTHYLGLIRKV